MSLSFNEIKKITDELIILFGGVIQGLLQLDKYTIILQVYKMGSIYNLLICYRPGFVRYHLVSKSIKNSGEKTKLYLFLKKHIIGLKIANIKTIQDDRIVEFQLEKKLNEFYYLVLELFDRKANILFLDGEKRIIYSKNKLENQRLAVYFPPPKSNFIDNTLVETSDNILYSEIIEKKYDKLVIYKKLETIFSGIKSLLGKEKKYLLSLKDKLNEQYLDCSNYMEFYNKGELLKANYYLLKNLKNSNSKIVRVVDYYSDSLKEVEIEVDVNLSPEDNINNFFKKAKKLKNGLEKVKLNLSATEDKLQKIKYLEELVDDYREKYLVKDNSKELLEEGLQKLEQLVYSLEDDIGIKKEILKLIVEEPVSKKDKKKEAEIKRYKYFISSKGYKIFVGRNSRENDELTFKVAKGNDLWCHTRNYPGSHVIVSMPKNVELDEVTLSEALALALNYSKCKNEKSAEVIYTKRKYLTKPKNAKPGQVIVSKFNSKIVYFDEDLIAKIKANQ